MTTLFKLEEHLMFLLVEDKLCFSEGDWDRLEQIRLAIDDTRDQIAKLTKVSQWKTLFWTISLLLQSVLCFASV